MVAGVRNFSLVPPPPALPAGESISCTRRQPFEQEERLLGGRFSRSCFRRLFGSPLCEGRHIISSGHTHTHRAKARASLLLPLFPRKGTLVLLRPATTTTALGACVKNTASRRFLPRWTAVVTLRAAAYRFLAAAEAWDACK